MFVRLSIYFTAQLSVCERFDCSIFFLQNQLNLSERGIAKCTDRTPLAANDRAKFLRKQSDNLQMQLKSKKLNQVKQLQYAYELKKRTAGHFGIRKL